MASYHPLIEIIVTSIVLAFFFGFIAKRLKLPTIIGYLVAGIMIGPHTPGYVGDPHLAAQLAEIGVILLMFSVGLHFSPKDLLAIKHIAIPGAVGQIGMAILMGTGLAIFRGYTVLEGIVFSIPLSVASTVVMLRALEQRRILQSQSGKIAIAWLVVEDIAMVLAIVLLPVMAGIVSNDGTVSLGEVVFDMMWILFKIACFAVIMFILGRHVLPGVIVAIVKFKSRELTSLAILSIALGFAFAAYSIFDASFALGAFLAGLVLNESEVGSKTAQQHLPLKDVFAVLFFVSVGMLFDPMIIVRSPWIVLAGLVVVMFGKSVAAYGLTRVFHQSRHTSMTVAASLAQIGEFSFIFAGMARQLNLLPEKLYDVILACALLSIALNPLMFKLANYLAPPEDEQKKGPPGSPDEPRYPQYSI